MRLADIALTGLRWLYGLFFFTTGVAITLYLVLGFGGPPPQPTAAAAAFDAALQKAGFINPLLAIGFLLGGGALALKRTTPLGLVLLAPSVAVIACDDILLAGAAPVGLAVAAIWGLLALRFFAGFRGLWTYGQGATAAKP
jgi:hypothetical protein